MDLYHLLASRDGVDCAALHASVDELVAMTDPAIQPPWVPVRAAECLVVTYPAEKRVAETILPWLDDPARKGLALVVAQHVDLLPADLRSKVCSKTSSCR
jgi:hypothetical protein